MGKSASCFAAVNCLWKHMSMNKTQTKTNQKGTDLSQLHVRGGHVPTRILRVVQGSKGSMCFCKGSLFKVQCIKALLSLNLNALHCHESKWETMTNNRTFKLSGCCKQRQSLIWKSQSFWLAGCPDSGGACNTLPLSEWCLQ